MLGKVQMKNMEHSISDAIQEEIEATKERENLEYHSYVVAGNEHRPLPMLALIFYS